MGDNIPHRQAMEKSGNQTMELTGQEKPPLKDFAAYFQSSPHRKEPIYMVTSHLNSLRIRSRKPTVTTYPVSQLRWNPYVETSPVEGESDESNYTQCKCRRCDMNNCPAKLLDLPSAVRPLRDNITRFCDQYTMTPKLASTCIGNTPPASSTHIYEVSAYDSDIAIRDTPARMRIQRLYPPEKCPSPILKRRRSREEEMPCSSKYCDISRISDDYVVESYDKPQREFVGYEPSRMSSIKSFFKSKKKRKPGRVVYNEGIDDYPQSRQQTHPAGPLRTPCHSNIKADRSRMSVRSRNSDDRIPREIHIPHCHRNDSRYHAHCKHPHTKPRYVYDGDEVRHMVVSPEARPNACTRQTGFCQPPCIRLPRKVLTSDRDIDDYYTNCSSFYTTKIEN